VTCKCANGCMSEM